jgi:hypothetical protein
LIFSFCSFYTILQEVAIKILNEDDSWFDLISEKIKEDEVLNDLGYYIDDNFFKKFNITFPENEYLYNNAVTILLFIDAISIERVLFNHYNNERNNIVSDYQFLKKYNSNGLFNFQGQTYYWSKESGSYNLLKKYDVNKLINFVNNYFKKMLTSISTKLSIDEFDFEYIVFENLVK